MAITQQELEVAPPGTSLPHQVIKVEDFRQRPGVELKLTDASISPQSILMQGHFHQRALGEGLVIRFGDSREECAYTATAKLEAGLYCIIFLRGDIEIHVANCRHRFNEPSVENTAKKMLAIHSQSPQSMQRISRHPQQVRYLSIAASDRWLESRFSDGQRPLGNDQLESLRFFSERLSRHKQLLVWEIIRQLNTVTQSNPLLLESKVIELLASTTATTELSTPALANRPQLTGATTRELQCFQRARTMIQLNTSEPQSVAEIARAAGTSATGLQRLFRKLEGMSVMEYARRLRMDQALNALRAGDMNVQQASALAGFRSPANFATAFRKMFGVSPREVLNTGKN
ncbi:AraC family transcriptional regulator [Microbulbifer mangrovi]|uniref:AraC family transcriptional regulator n=1 Tax=Microbulbifer mangrovi TaxID=927787 RepID=UPI0009905213|nr:AraC family transcriptional regulator [Microbulbifer mangrovi]